MGDNHNFMAQLNKAMTEIVNVTFDASISWEEEV
jgi:hypothetical protein